MVKTLLLIVATLAPSTLAGEIVGQQVTGANANPIRRVVSLLQGMAKKVTAEGEKEKELYEKFMCYCKTGASDLSESISSSNTKVPQVQSDIEESESKLKQTQLDLKKHQTDRADAKSAMASATAQREGEHSKYVAESDELKGYVSSLSTAIPAIEQGMSGTFLQAKVGSMAALQKAVVSSEQATEYDKQYVAAFLSGHTSNGYVPKSGEITGILKEMLADFKKNLAAVEEEEAGQVKLYEELMAAKTKQVEALTASIEKKSVMVGELQVSIVSMKNDLTETEAALIADKKFLADMDKSCATKTAEMEERVKTRSEELVAIQDTIKILNDDDALELFKKTLPSPSLLQVKANSAKLASKALKLIRSLRHEDSALGPRPGLDLLAMALSGSARKVDFSKVIKMIDDMVALLKTEQMDDDNKKEYCEMQLDQVEDKAKELTSKVEDLTASIEEKEELIKTAVSEIKVLTKNIQKLDKSVSDATFQRKKEHDEFVELMSSDQAAKELLGFEKKYIK
jgi:septal ring factor EnvC (AmiA/AmiB activator)